MEKTKPLPQLLKPNVSKIHLKLIEHTVLSFVTNIVVARCMDSVKPLSRHNNG